MIKSSIGGSYSWLFMVIHGYQHTKILTKIQVTYLSFKFSKRPRSLYC